MFEKNKIIKDRPIPIFENFPLDLISPYVRSKIKNAEIIVNNLKFKVIFMISKFGFNNKRLKIPIMKPFNMGKLTNLLKLLNIFLFI